MGSKDNLVPKQIVNSAGINTTVYVRPDQASNLDRSPLRSIGAPAPATTSRGIPASDGEHPDKWPLKAEDFDRRFEQGIAQWAMDGDSPEQWTIFPADESMKEAIEEMAAIEDEDEREDTFGEYMDESGGGYLLSDGRILRYTGED